MKKGKFFVFEGIDGSGKSTQANLLAEYFKKRGYRVEKIDFPQYGNKSAGLVEKYLSGEYGDAEKVGPYRASIFYACDRYDASFKIKKWLDEGKIVISDRYLVSNIGHQGGKIIKNKKEWEKYVNWLYNLEYGIFGIPKPDYTIILKSVPDFSLRLAHKLTDKVKKAKRKIYLGNKKSDIHENIKHLRDTLNSYLLAAKESPQKFKVIECMQGKDLLPPDVINQKIIKLIEKKI